MIIKNAKKLFLRNGFECTSMSNIADACGINKSLIYHHNKNKEELWKTIKEDMFNRYQQLSDRELDYEDMSLYELLENIVNFRFNFYFDNPEIIRLMCWQRLEENPDKISGISSEIFTSLVNQISRLQQEF
ncbi:MAG: TetR/AcrR family transcriptional regulator [Atribacterota bacterium]|nr:TetR/AcrR family transcriptional regulator [Atribacterota bacterium]